MMKIIQSRWTQRSKKKKKKRVQISLYASFHVRKLELVSNYISRLLGGRILFSQVRHGSRRCSRQSSRIEGDLPEDVVQSSSFFDTDYGRPTCHILKLSNHNATRPKISSLTIFISGIMLVDGRLDGISLVTLTFSSLIDSCAILFPRPDIPHGLID
jgi:hypothetical protein